MKVHPAARQAARELEAMGVPLLTLEEAAQILAAASMLPTTDAAAAPITLGMPVRVGDIVLYPPTIAGIEFILRVGTDEPLATPFSLANGRRPEILEAIITRSDLRRAINDFRRRAGCTASELLAASALAQGIAHASADADRLEQLEDAADIIAETNPKLADAVRKEASVSYANALSDARAQTPMTAMSVLAVQREALEHLAALCGVPPDHWRGTDATVVWNIYRHAQENEAQRNSAAAGALGVVSRPANGNANPMTTEAIREMRRVVTRIVAAHKGMKDHVE